MTYKEIYNSKRGEINDALAIIQNNDTIVTSFYANEPIDFLTNLHTIANRVKGVNVWVSNAMAKYQFLTDHSLKGKIDVRSLFYGELCRKEHNSDRFSYYPCNLQASSKTICAASESIVLVISTSGMDENGYFHVSWDLEMIDSIIPAARKIIIEVNNSMPFRESVCKISVKDVACVYECAREFPILDTPKESKEDIKIAEYAASLIKDGDTIQLGIGAMPNIVGKMLKEKKELGIHTEMFTSSMAALIKSGAVTNENKNINKGLTVCGFCHGDKEMYKTLMDNPSIKILPNSYVNNPVIIAQHDNFVSVNSALQVDLSGQVCSESIGSKQYSGTGGAMDFAIGAYYSKGGRSIIAINSTVKGGLVSKIQAVLSPGAAVSIPRTVVDYIITEYGIAKIKGQSIRARVDNLIAIAHPDFKEELRRQAETLMLR